jgi:hypothetical protein
VQERFIPHFPADVVKRIAEFCASNRTGTITLNVKDGRIISGTIAEPFKAKDAPVD